MGPENMPQRWRFTCDICRKEEISFKWEDPDGWTWLRIVERHAILHHQALMCPSCSDSVTGAIKMFGYMPDVERMK